VSSGCARWGDAPESFGETAVEVEARPTSYWEDLTRSVTEPGQVGGMWVDPAWRRRGVGRLLLQAVFDWARGRELTRLGLWAPARSPAAIALYSRAGFRMECQL
jgi:GNAT superfamily N-acetyltransferase